VNEARKNGTLANPEPNTLKQIPIVIVSKAETIPNELNKSAQFDENQSGLLGTNNKSSTINEFENDSEIFQKRKLSRSHNFSNKNTDSALPCIKPEIGENYSNMLEYDVNPNQFYSNSDQSYSPRVFKSDDSERNMKRRDEIELRELRSSYPPREQILSSKHIKLPPLGVKEKQNDSSLTFNKKERRTSLMNKERSGSRSNKPYEDSLSEDENVVISKYKL